jgi:small-conductance mechanosensitive channel
MSSFWIKAFAIPAILALTAWVLPDVRYDAWFMPVTIGLILAVAGMLMEYLLLREGNLWFATFADFVVAVPVVYFFSNMFAGAEMSFTGALIASLLIAAAEFYVHRWLLRTGRVDKLA